MCSSRALSSNPPNRTERLEPDASHATAPLAVVSSVYSFHSRWNAIHVQNEKARTVRPLLFFDPNFGQFIQAELTRLLNRSKPEPSYRTEIFETDGGDSFASRSSVALVRSRGTGTLFNRTPTSRRRLL
jgi:hypothetical protein